jgi:hypothetical protein
VISESRSAIAKERNESARSKRVEKQERKRERNCSEKGGKGVRGIVIVDLWR